MDLGLFKIKSTKLLHVQFAPLTDDELTAYNRGEWPPISKANIRADFVSGWKRGEYNRDARAFIIDDFIREANGGLWSDPQIPSRFLTAEIVGDVVDGHMEYLRG